MSSFRKYISIGQEQYLMEVHVEIRNGWRVSIGRKAIIVRLPLTVANTGYQQYEDQVLAWLHKIALTKPRALEHLKSRKIADTSHSFEILGKKYQIEIQFEPRDSLKGSLSEDIVRLILPDMLMTSKPQHLNTINQLISRIICDVYNQPVEKRVREINRKFFGQAINSVRMKYIHSRWGSCSSNKNINLSSRLLLTPSPVLDYVIIHELAHLVEMNHSAAFWKLVAAADPTYKQKERWLKLNGHKCQFI